MYENLSMMVDLSQKNNIGITDISSIHEMGVWCNKIGTVKVYIYITIKNKGI